MVFPDIISEQLSEFFTIEFICHRDDMDLLGEPVYYYQDGIVVFDFL